jgi:hypothetical protein
MYIDIVKNVDKYITSIFSYTEDVGDAWDSSFSDIIKAEIAGDVDFRFKGDCEDKSQTALEYAHYKGVPLANLARCIVDSYPYPGAPPEGHMVALFFDDITGGVYYFGDTFGDMCKTNERGHVPKLVNFFNDGNDWIKYDTFKFK